MRNKYVLGIISCIILFVSCQKKIDFDKLKPIQYNGDWAAPLAYGDFSIEDILEGDSSSYFYYDQEGLIYLTYTSKLASLDLKDIIPNNKTNYSTTRDLTAGESTQLAGTNSLSVYFNEDISIDDLNTNGVAFELDSIHIKSGVFEFDIKSRIDHKIEIEMDIPALMLNGVPYNRTVQVDENSNNNIIIDVSGYSIDLTKNGTTHSSFEASFKATITKGPSPNYAGGIDVDLEIKNGYAIKTAFGDAKRQDLLALNKTNLDIELFEIDEIGKTVFLEDALLKIKWVNSFGLPIDIVLNDVIGKNSNGQNFSLDVANIPSIDLIITSPSVVGKETNGEIVINNSKTQTGGGKLSLKDFINENIVEMSIDAEAFSNPPGVTRPVFKNFINENSALDLEIEAALPLHGRATGYAFKDTFDMDLGDVESDEVEKASIKIFSVNGFPIDFEGAVAFLDSNNNLLFTIDKRPDFFFRAAQVDASGKVIQPTENVIELEIANQDLDKLGSVNKVSVIANFSTTDKGTIPVKFHKDDMLSVKIGARVKVNTEI